MRTNIAVKQIPVFTHGGARAVRPGAALELRRAVMACMLWEDQFYESGTSIADRIAGLVAEIDATDVMSIAIEARHLMKLRHVPLWICVAMARSPEHRKLVGHTLEQVIERPDEITEFLSLYWGGADRRTSKHKLAKQVKLGLAAAFNKFNAYALAKYNRADGVKLRDALFLVHNNPVHGVTGRGQPRNPVVRPNYSRGSVQRHAGATLTKLVEDALPEPDTWEVALSAGEDKRATFERLISTQKLGALALLRNLRNMAVAGVPKALVEQALYSVPLERVLPFRFIAAARACPAWEDIIETAMLRQAETLERLRGKTVLVVDVSGSMSCGNVSAKSELTRVDAAKALAILLRNVCEEVSIYATAGSDIRRVHATKRIPPRQGFALGDAIFNLRSEIGSGGIFLKQCMDHVYARESVATRVVVLTDEQDCDLKANPATALAFGSFNYLINVASYENGIGFGRWTTINGWSEAIVDYMRAFEEGEQ